MEKLFRQQDALLTATSMEIVRQAMDDVDWSDRLVGIRGSRGVGKTTLLLQYVKGHYPPGSREALYCSLDGMYFADHTLLALAEAFYRQGGQHLLLDEVHKYPRWAKEIKEIYDTLPSLRVTFTGSSLLNLLNADADLSRRCLPYTLHGLSFREFLMFYHGLRFPRTPLAEILARPAEICRQVNEVCRPLQMFDQYLHEGYYPFFDGRRQAYYLRLEGIANLVLEQEMPQMCGVDPAYTRKLKALLGVLATSVPFEVDVAKLARTIELSRNSVINYLNALGRAEMLTLLYSDLLSVKRLQKPDKIYLHNPNLLYALSSAPVHAGTARECFAVNQLSAAHKVEYGKAQGDFRVDGRYTFEVGGPEKGFRQLGGLSDAYVLADGIEHPYGNKLPLWLLGMER